MVMALGTVVAAAHFPGGYDWAYTVISWLASTRRNPVGARWLSGGALVGVVLLWPVTSYLLRAHATGEGKLPRAAVASLRVGLAGGAVLGVEGLLALRFSDHLHKAHEAVAIVTFLGFYGGVLGLYAHLIRDRLAALAPALLVILPLLAVGVTQLVLYLGQEELGWVRPEWREIGVPVWLSFAFWQWIAVVLLAVGLGYLAWAGGSVDERGPPTHEKSPDSASAADPRGMYDA